jgi:hypothetical protein
LNVGLVDFPYLRDAPRTLAVNQRIGANHTRSFVRQAVTGRQLKPVHRLNTAWRIPSRGNSKVIVAFDFFTVPTLTFRLLYCFFVIEHDRRRILHFDVAREDSQHQPAENKSPAKQQNLRTRLEADCLEPNTKEGTLYAIEPPTAAIPSKSLSPVPRQGSSPYNRHSREARPACVLCEGPANRAWLQSNNALSF